MLIPPTLARKVDMSSPRPFLWIITIAGVRLKLRNVHLHLSKSKLSLMFNGTTHLPALEGITFSGSFQALETTVHGAL